MATATIDIAQMEQEQQVVRIAPQVGPQTAFAQCNADILVYGGQRGGGKTASLLREPLKYIHHSDFQAVIFRRTYTEITAAGAMWDDSEKLYPLCGGKAVETKLLWTFPSGASIKFAHMQHEKDRMQWLGSQIPFIGFDQLESFSERQFVYLIPCNRSMCDVRPHIRTTCNPAPDHWLREWLDWWIGEDGCPIYSRSGIVRYFVMIGDEREWGESREELIDKFGENVKPTSFTFIPSRVTDNRILIDKNPEYLTKLENLPHAERARMLEGNWDVKESAGEYFQRPWFEIVDAAGAGTLDMRYWDRAATKAQLGKEARASWTAGLKLRKTVSGLWYVVDVVRFQGSPLEVEQTILNVASQDGRLVEIGIEGDPGQAGKAEAEGYVRRLAGYIVRTNFVRENKGIRAKFPSAQAEAGNIKLVRCRWNEAFLKEVVNFDGSSNCTSDQVDALSGAFYLLTQQKTFGTW